MTLQTQSKDQTLLATQQPIILVGCMRSGSTLLRLILDHHPQISFMFESEFMVDRIEPDGSMPDLPRYHEYLKAHRVFNLSELKITEARDVPELLNDFFRQRRQAYPEATIIGATIHRAFDRVPYIWPKARYVHLIRDGRDVARSVIQMGWAGNNWFGIEPWLDAEYTWQKLQPTLAPDQYIEVKYETLVSNAREELTRICEFLGVEFDDAMFDYRHSSDYGMPDPKLAQQWRRKQSPADIQLAEARGGEMLRSLGYELSAFPPITVGSFKAWRLGVHNWWRRARFRMKRYGMPLFFADYFARHVGTDSMRQTTRRKIHAVDNAHLR